MEKQSTAPYVSSKPRTITIKKIMKEPIDSTIGAFVYAYLIDYNGNYSYTLRTTEESLMYLMGALKEGKCRVEYLETYKDGK